MARRSAGQGRGGDRAAPVATASTISPRGTATGDYEVFAHGYWISMSSSLFAGTNMSGALIQAALDVL